MCSVNFGLKLQNTVKHNHHIMGRQEHTPLECSFDCSIHYQPKRIKPQFKCKY